MSLLDLNKKRIVLGSASLRRKQLMKELGFEFEIIIAKFKEKYPETLAAKEIPVYLAELKSEALEAELDDRTIVITADTVVIVENEVLGKPADFHAAKKNLSKLSGKMHEVVTGVCIRSRERKHTFGVNTRVYFKNLRNDEIDYYITHYHPYDKAGAYGIQEWIGHIGIKRINGSYSNVVGLPVQEVYKNLRKFT